MNNPVTTREWIGRRRLRASVDRTLGVKVPKVVFDEAEAYARRKMAFQNEVLGLDRGDEYLELLIPDVIREMALAARYDGMSCGRLALLNLGVNITNYYATEIDKYAIATTQENFPDTIQLGDAFQVREDDWTLQKGGVINE